MQAGIPLKGSVAGVAMGLVKEGDKYAVLTDIAGAEDHYGDMDFKVAGTRNGITALQMDIKIMGITTQIMREALEQARRAASSSSTPWTRHLQGAEEKSAVRSAHPHHPDPHRQDPRPHRTWRQGHPRHRRCNGRQDRCRRHGPRQRGSSDAEVSPRRSR
jgi:hypothetical protein